MPRIASLLPSLTEIVCALGCRDQLVARSHECDYPNSVLTLPACTEPKFDPIGTNAKVNARIEVLIRQGLSIYHVDNDQLRDISPDVILTQDQCKACAASLTEVEEAVSQWFGSRPQILSLAPQTLDDVWEDIGRVAQAIDVPERGRLLRDQISSQLVRIETLTLRQKRPRVVCIDWLDPLMAAANWIPELVTLAGGENLLTKNGLHSSWLDWNTLGRADPDLMVLFPCGLDIDHAREELHLLESQASWRNLRAVTSERIAIADGNHYFNRSGPRLVDSLEIFAEIFHPNTCSFGHHGMGWVWAQEL